MQTWQRTSNSLFGRVIVSLPRTVPHNISLGSQLFQPLSSAGRHAAGVPPPPPPRHAAGVPPPHPPPLVQPEKGNAGDAHLDGTLALQGVLSDTLPRVDNDTTRGRDATQLLGEVRDEDGGLPVEGAQQLVKAVGTGDDLEAMQDFIEAALQVDQEYPKARVVPFVLQQLTMFWRALEKACAMKTPETQERARRRATCSLVTRIDRGLSKKLQAEGPELVDKMVLSLARCHAQPVLLMDELLTLAQQPIAVGEAAGAGFADTSSQHSLFDTQAAGGATDAQPPPRPEPKSKYKRILDVDVRCELDAEAAKVHVPPPDRTVIMSGLPPGTTEEVLRQALSACGQVHRVELIEVFSPILRVFAPVEVVVPGSEGTTDPTRKSEGCYAIVEFQTEDGYRHATRRAVRLFGVILQVLIPKGKKKKLSPSGWPAFPQVAQHKRSIVLTGLPWSERPRDILVECAQQLQRFAARTGSGECVLELTNCRSFRATRSTHIESLVVHARADDHVPMVREQPVKTGPVPKQYWNDGSAVLRFKSFEQANIARQILGNVRFGDRQMSCDFAPQRPYFFDEDSAGNPLEQPCFVDFPVQRRRNDKAYNREMDPIVRYGIPVDEFDDFDASRMRAEPP